MAGGGPGGLTPPAGARVTGSSWPVPSGREARAPAGLGAPVPPAPIRSPQTGKEEPSVCAGRKTPPACNMRPAPGTKPFLFCGLSLFQGKATRNGANVCVRSCAHS